MITPSRASSAPSRAPTAQGGVTNRVSPATTNTTTDSPTHAMLTRTIVSSGGTTSTASPSIITRAAPGGGLLAGRAGAVSPSAGTFRPAPQVGHRAGRPANDSSTSISDPHSGHWKRIITALRPPTTVFHHALSRRGRGDLTAAYSFASTDRL